MRVRYGRFWALVGLVCGGCSSPYGETFECPPGKGVGCRSISTVNHLVDHGAFDGAPEEGPPKDLDPGERPGGPAGPGPRVITLWVRIPEAKDPSSMTGGLPWEGGAP